MKRRDLRKVHPLRQLNDDEIVEEEIYRRQLKDSWGFRPGEHPVDVYQRKREMLEDK